MQRITLEELKHILYHAFRDHLTMKDIENIIINEEESLNENSGNCQTEFEGEPESPWVSVHYPLPVSANPLWSGMRVPGVGRGLFWSEQQGHTELPPDFSSPSAKLILFQAQG
ncbi:hypothetical protein Nmel_016510 [Mimus melanotis]